MSQLLALLCAPCAGLIITSATVVYIQLRGRKDEDADEGAPSAALQEALAASVVAHHVEGILFSFIIPSSLDMAEALGRGATFAGSLIGFHKMGTATGSLALWLAKEIRPETWRAGRHIYWGALCLQAAGNACFVWLGTQVDDASTGTEGVGVGLLAARFVTGLGGGVQIFLALLLFAHALEPAERAAWNVSFFISGVSGLGTGPLSAAVTAHLTGNPGFPALLSTLALAPLVQLPCAASYPPLWQVVDRTAVRVDDAQPATLLLRQDNAAALDQTQAALMPRRSGAVVLCCVALQALRNLTISGLEAGSAVVLQRRHGWSPATVGYAIAAIACSVVPSRWLYGLTLERLAPAAAQRALFGIMLLGVAMMFAPDVALLVGGGMVALAGAAISAGLVVTMLQRHTVEDRCLDLNRSMLLVVVGCDLLGRGFGPIMASFVADRGGKQGLVLLLLVYVMAGMAFFEAAQFLSPFSGNSYCITSQPEHSD